jgi:hypothetical protein
MARFEKRITESEVAAARDAIAAGSSLRSVAATIPCAPSTLSVRIAKAKAAEAEAGGPTAIGNTEIGTSQPGTGHPAASVIGAGESVRTGAVDPLEILRTALQATKNGQPHWPTRLAAVRMLATLRPEEFHRSADEQPTEPSIVVFDLERCAVPVLHRARKEEEPPVSSEDADPPLHETSSTHHVFSHETPDGERVLIGTWSPLRRDESAVVAGVLHTTDNAGEAERWRAELSAGGLPTGAENVS